MLDCTCVGDIQNYSYVHECICGTVCTGLHIDTHSLTHYTCTTCMNFCLCADPCKEVIATVLQYVALGNDATLPVPNGLELVSRLGYACFARYSKSKMGSIYYTLVQEFS